MTPKESPTIHTRALGKRPCLMGGSRPADGPCDGLTRVTNRLATARRPAGVRRNQKIATASRREVDVSFDAPTHSDCMSCTGDDGMGTDD